MSKDKAKSTTTTPAAKASSSNPAGGSTSAARQRKYSQRYPRSVGVDFRTLPASTLLSYVGHYGINIVADAPPSELGVAVAQHFDTLEVDEDRAIGAFLSRLESGGGCNDAAHLPPTAAPSSSNASMLSVLADQALADYVRSSTYFDGHALTPTRRKWKRRKYAASQGDQVAAKVTRTDENGSWILAYVLKFYPESETYDVQDEDDTSKLIRLPWNHVMRLSTGQEGWLDKGSKVMAIFPETTSFYRAVVSKHPVWTDGTGEGENGKPRVKEVILKFEDDEDQDGKTPHRRVPSRYVIPLPHRYFFEDEDDVDLTAPSSTVRL
jgi:SAGA-associated factor 29